MDVKQPPGSEPPGDPDPPPGDPGLPDADLRLLWPESAPETAQSVDQESAAMAERRARVFRLYARGKTMRQVAEEAGTSLATVCRDVNHVLDAYRLAALQDAHHHVARELARLAAIEAELWDAWERSKGEATETTTARRGGASGEAGESRTRRRQRDGDPRVMRLVLGCWERRCRLLGLLRAEDFKDTGAMPPVKLVAGLDPAELV